MVYVLVWVDDLFIVGPHKLVDSVRAAVSRSGPINVVFGDGDSTRQSQSHHCSFPV
jgi:hypothetical protein